MDSAPKQEQAAPMPIFTRALEIAPGRALSELTRVRLTATVDQNGRTHPAGRMGTIVHVYDHGVAYIVETTVEGDPMDGLLTLGPDQIEAIADQHA